MRGEGPQRAVKGGIGRGAAAAGRGCADTLARIRERAHYTITVRPRTPRDLSFDDLEDILEDCVVRCRGRSYPYMPGVRNGGAPGPEECIEACWEKGPHADAWRLCRSGQFRQYLGLYEARWQDDGSQGAASAAPPPPRERFLEPFVTMYQVSEVFLFASRLAGRLLDVWTVAISLSDMQGRALDIRAPRRFGRYGDYVCSLPVIDLYAELDSLSLQARYGEIAIEKTMEIMRCFGRDSKTLESIFREEQEKMYRHGEARSIPGLCVMP